MSVFEPRYHNDAIGRLAYDPKVLLKVVVYGYYRGFVSSRRIAEACCRNLMFMALSADSRPHFQRCCRSENSEFSNLRSRSVTGQLGVLQPTVT